MAFGLWMHLHTAHRAPTPADVPKDNHLSIAEFLQAFKRRCEESAWSTASALELSRQIAQEYSTAAVNKRQQTRPRPLVTQNAHPNATVTAYYAHYENIKRHLHMEDMSRVDAMIALRLRATGHSPEAVLAAVFQCAPSIRPDNGKKEGRNWHQYAERTTSYAFGTAGDVTLTKNERFLEHWKKIEGQKESIMC